MTDDLGEEFIIPLKCLHIVSCMRHLASEPGQKEEKVKPSSSEKGDESSSSSTRAYLRSHRNPEKALLEARKNASDYFNIAKQYWEGGRGIKRDKRNQQTNHTTTVKSFMHEQNTGNCKI